MSTKIEFHVLQSFPPANLNRDDTNMPKDCEFGGVRRARISSQCIKRSIRLHPDFEKQTGVAPALRSRNLASKISESISPEFEDKELAFNISRVFAAELLSGMDADDIEIGRTRALFYFAEAELNEFTSTILDNREDIIKIVEKLNIEKHLVKKFTKPQERKLNKYIGKYITDFKKSPKIKPDIALFGRMLALHPALGMEASCQVAHAISTHPVNMEIDYFTAVEELKVTEDSGSAMIGVTGFNSATFYRYAAIDWGQLIKNLDGDTVLAQKTVAGFTYALAKAIPTGKQNAFAAQTPPAMILAVVRDDGQAWSLANAFEKPVRSDYQHSILQKSVAALDQHWQQLSRVYGDPDQPAKPFALLIDPECTMKALQENKVDTLIELVNAVCGALPQE